MNLFSWAIVIIPLVFVLWLAFHSRKYIHDVADYLACGRVAGRYVISVGDLTAALSVITLVAMSERYYQTGLAMTFWYNVNVPLAIFLSLTGYCVYRFRQTKCLSCGQFFELRYSRSFRIAAASIRTIAEMITNAIGPAVAVRFFIYFLGLPHKLNIFGLELPTYTILVGVLLLLALAIIWPAGRVSLLVTDCLQGIISYPIFVIITVFILTEVSWFGDIAPVMLDRAPDESFLNPMDVENLRDFNMFALIVTLVSTVLNRAAWIGNDTSNAARSPHEQKMAGVLGTWRNGFSWTMMGLVAVFVITFMLHDRFADKARAIRGTLANKVAEEVFDNSPELQRKLKDNFSALPAANHKIGTDTPYSRTENPDTPFFKTALDTIHDNGLENGNQKFQEFRSIYNQMMMPVMLKSLFPPVLMGLFALLMIMLLLSSDDSRIFNASSSLIQDIILPLRKTPLTTEQHLKYLKICSLLVTMFFFVIASFFSQLDYIEMFITIMCAVWTGASGPIMVGGLYSRFGNATGAWCALIFGSGTSVLGIVFQRNWADIIYPWLERTGLVASVATALETISGPFEPLIIWRMDPIKFPINSTEIYFIAMILGVIAYCVGSWITYKEPYNLDRLFHRGIYADENAEEEPKVKKFSWKNIYNNLVGITPEYTFGDKCIAWSVFGWTIIYQFGLMFCGVLIWNAISPWPAEYWGIYFFIIMIGAAFIVGGISTIWSSTGGLIDMRNMFRNLKARVANPLDNGVVEGEVSLADKERFEKIEENSQK